MFNLQCLARILLIACLLSQAISTGFGAEAADCRTGSGYVLYANDHGQSDDSSNDYSSNLYVLNPYLRNTELAYPLNPGETGIREMTDIAFLPDAKLFGVTFTRLLAIDTVTRQGEFVGDIVGDAYLNEERRIDPHSGQAEIIGDIGFKQVFSLAVGPRDELLGVADGNGRPLLIKVNKHNGKGKLIAPLPDTDGMWGMILRDLCADHR